MAASPAPSASASVGAASSTDHRESDRTRQLAEQLLVARQLSQSITPNPRQAGDRPSLPIEPRANYLDAIAQNLERIERFFLQHASAQQQDRFYRVMVLTAHISHSEALPSLTPLSPHIGRLAEAAALARRLNVEVGVNLQGRSLRVAQVMSQLLATLSPLVSPILLAAFKSNRDTDLAWPAAAITGPFSDWPLEHRELAIDLFYKHIEFTGMDICKIRLGGRDLNRRNFSYANAQGTSFASSQLNRACFDRALLTQSSFQGAHAESASFIAASLGNANFRWATLRSTNFDGARLKATDFRSADLSNANLSGIRCSRVLFRNANLDGTDFSHAFFDGFPDADFAGANLTGAQIIFGPGELDNLDRRAFRDHALNFASQTWTERHEQALVKHGDAISWFDYERLQIVRRELAGVVSCSEGITAWSWLKTLDSIEPQFGELKLGLMVQIARRLNRLEICKPGILRPAYPSLRRMLLRKPLYCTHPVTRELMARVTVDNRTLPTGAASGRSPAHLEHLVSACAPATARRAPLT